VNGPVSAHRIGGVLQLVLDAPRRKNALSRPMLGALAGHFADLDEDVTGVVISGNGGVFSAGADFAELTGTSADLEYDDAVNAVREAIWSCPRLVVAALEGPSVGAAADLALACDFQVAGEDSFLEIPAVRLGLLYNPEALASLARTLPATVVRRLVLLGERFDAREAFTCGLVTHLAPRGDAAKRAVELLDAVTSSELDAIAATKGFLRAVATGDDAASTWQDRRRELLDSPARRAAIELAQARHPHGQPRPQS
jgi:enoyl-CoA hydratase